MPNRQKFANLDGGSAKGADAGEVAANEGGNQESSVQQGSESKGEQGGDESKGSAPELKYTDADVSEMITKRLAREHAKLEREIRESIAKERENEESQAKKLENMTELQRAQYEAKKLQEEKEALIAERDLTQQMTIARNELANVGINMGDELLGMFVSHEAEKTSAAIDRIKELWPKAVNDAVQKELKRTPPPAESNPAKKSFGASYAEKYTSKMNGGKE